MQQAMALLQTTALPVEQVADAVGFQQPKQFALPLASAPVSHRGYTASRQ